MIGRQNGLATEVQPSSTGVPSTQELLLEWRKCKRSPAYFIDTYCKMLDSVSQDWIPFKLWREQYEVLQGWQQNQYNITLKARQLGLTWLALGQALWQIVFFANAEVMLVSRRQDEAFYIAGEERLRGMYKQLPTWMKADGVIRDNASHWRLSNGSGARAFPSNNVDSYSANLMVIDEADHPGINLRVLLNSAKPTIDAGGKLLLVSRSYKEKPASYFKQLYRVAKAGKNEYNAAFLPWHVHTGRTRAWYEKQCATAMANEGTLDSVYEQYPETDEQALAPRSLDKRIPPAFLSHCYVEGQALTGDDLKFDAPRIGGLTIYKNPEKDATYVIGADPAEGNPTSDDSAATVLDLVTGEEVASLAGKFQVDVFAAHLKALAGYFNEASVMVERNNHGHAVLLWLKDNSKVRLLKGLDGRVGWQTNTVSKAEMYSSAVVTFREGDTVIHSFDTLTQLQEIEGSTLKAPEGEMDDRAVSFVLALMARGFTPRRKKRVVAGGLYTSRNKRRGR